MKTITFRVPDDKAEMLDKLAGLRGLSRSSLMRKLLEEEGQKVNLKEARMEYPSDPKTSSLYKLLLEEAGIYVDSKNKNSNPKIPWKRVRYLGYKANIKTSDSLRNILNVLDAQGFVARKKDYLVVTPRWRE